MNAAHSMRVAAVLLALLFCSDGEVVIKDNPEAYTRWAHNVCAVTTEEGYVMMWQGTKNGTKEIAAQRYDTNGSSYGDKIRITADTEDLVDRKCSITTLEGGEVISAHITDGGIGVTLIAHSPDRVFFSIIETDINITSLIVSPLSSDPSDNTTASIFASTSTGILQYPIQLTNGVVSSIPPTTIAPGVALSSVYLEGLNEVLLNVVDDNGKPKMIMVDKDGRIRDMNISDSITSMTLSAMVRVPSQDTPKVAVYWTGDNGSYLQMYDAGAQGEFWGNRLTLSLSKLPDIHLGTVPSGWLIATETETSSQLTGHLLRIGDNGADDVYEFLIKDHYESEQFSGLVLGFEFSNIGGFAVMWHGLGAAFTQHFNIMQYSLSPTTAAPETYAPETLKPKPTPPPTPSPTLSPPSPSPSGSHNETSAPQTSSSSSFPKWIFALIAFLLLDVIVIVIYLYRRKSSNQYVPTGDGDDHEMELPVRDYSPPYIQ